MGSANDRRQDDPAGRDRQVPPQPRIAGALVRNGFGQAIRAGEGGDSRVVRGGLSMVGPSIASSAVDGRRGRPRSRAVRAGCGLLLVRLAWGAGAVGAPASASAETGHNFISQLPLPLLNPEAPVGAVTVDLGGNVFVADDAAGVVYVFDSSGNYRTQFGGGKLANEEAQVEITGLAADSAGRSYVSANGPDRVDVFKPSGSGVYSLLFEWTGLHTPHHEFGQPRQRAEALGGVAVDNSTNPSDPAKGHVYVIAPAHGEAYVFKPPEGSAPEASEGEFLTTLKGKPALEKPVAVAVDSSTGSVYVSSIQAESKPDLVEAFNAAGEFQFRIGAGNTPNKPFGPGLSLAVEEATGDLLMATNDNLVEQFSSTGIWLGAVPAAAGIELSALARVAIDNSASPSKGRLYLANGPKAVDVFGPNTV